MSRKDDLEESIRESYGLVRDYEQIRQTSSDPKEKNRAQLAEAEQWEFIKSYLDEYLRLSTNLSVKPAADVVEIAVILDHPLTSAAQTLPPPAALFTAEGAAIPITLGHVYCSVCGATLRLNIWNAKRRSRGTRHAC